MRAKATSGPLFRPPREVLAREDGTEQSGLEQRGLFDLLARPAVRRCVLLPTVGLFAAGVTGPSLMPAVHEYFLDSYEGP